jgi:iron complex outermembrane receptor protein
MRRKFAMAGVNWDLDAALFRIDRDDYIMSTAGQYASTLEDELLRYENIGGMQSRGLELSLRSDSSNKFWVNVAYSYLDAFFTQYDNYNLLLGHRYGDSFDEAIDGDNNGICDDAGFDPESMYCLEHYDLTGNQVPRAPRHHLNIGLNWRAAPHWILTGEIEAKSSYYADEMNWNKVSGHTVFNLLATYDRKFGEDNTVSFFARIDNVFDKDYWNTARGSYDSSSPGTGGVPDGVFDMEDISIVVNPGRTFTAGLNVTF